MAQVELSKTLYLTDGASDKVYKLDLVRAEGGLYHVVCFNGRRGGALKEQPKTKSPVTRADAMDVFESVFKEKTRKGYTEASSGVAYAMTEKQGQVSGWLPMLATPVGAEEAEVLLLDDGVVVQVKYDGERRGVEYLDGQLRGMNRKGLYVATPESWVEAAEALGDGTVIDGEHVGDVLHVFDALKIAGVEV